MGRDKKKTDHRGFFVILIPLSGKREILIEWLPVNLLTNPSKLRVCIQCRAFSWEKVSVVNVGLGTLRLSTRQQENVLNDKFLSTLRDLNSQFKGWRKVGTILYSKLQGFLVFTFSSFLSVFQNSWLIPYLQGFTVEPLRKQRF